MKERRACPECGGDVEAHGAPGSYYCPECDDVVVFDMDEDAEEVPAC